MQRALRVVKQVSHHVVRYMKSMNPRLHRPLSQLLEHPWVAQGRTEAGNQNLSHFKHSMKAYNARRKFKATIMTVHAMGKFGRAMGGASETSQPAPIAAAEIVAGS